MSCDAKPQNLSSAVPHDQQSIEQAKRDRRHEEQIHRRDAVGMVMKKRLPALRRWPSSLHHILGHARLADIDAELKQLSVDPRRAPQRVGDAHLADKLAYLSGFKTARAFRTVGANRYSPAKIKRSMALNVCLWGECRLSMLIWCRRTRISAANEDRDPN